LGLVNLVKFDSIKGMIPLTMIPLSGVHCIWKHLMLWLRGGRRIKLPNMKIEKNTHHQKYFLIGQNIKSHELKNVPLATLEELYNLKK